MPDKVRWQAARKHLTLVTDGGLRLPGDPPPVFRTAPLPDGVDIQLWEQCGCDYQPPHVDGRPVPQNADPAWTQWSEDPTHTAAGKQSLRLALTRKPRSGDPGGLLGPNFYQLPHFHSGDARKDQPGFPDLLIWSERGREAWELKKMGEVPTLPQAVHMTSLGHGRGFVVRLVRPCCLLSGWVDRWLAALAGVEANLSPWAPGRGGCELDAARERRTVRALTPPPPVAAPADVDPLPAPPVAAPPRQRRLQLVPAPPGAEFDEAQASAAGRTVGYVVPMPTDTAGWRAAGQLEQWLRAAGFAASDVPWPIRFAVAESTGLLVVRVNIGSPPGPGQPPPRAWRTGTVDVPVPEDLIRTLRGDMVAAPTMPGALGFIENVRPAATIS